MTVSFTYGRPVNVCKPDAGIGERDERIYRRKSTNTEALSVTVILMNNVIALIVAFFIMFTYKISYAGCCIQQEV